MLQRLDAAFSVVEQASMAALRGDVLADLRHGIRRAGEHRRGLGTEHLEVVVAVADGEGLQVGQAEVPGDFHQTTTFLILRVAEAQPDRVALPA